MKFWNFLAACFSNSAKIPGTTKFCKCWERHRGTFYRCVTEDITLVFDSILMDETLQNLDALHDHLGTLYPGMRAPSFRCTERPEDGALVLHYYSDRPGLEHIVIGIVKVNAISNSSGARVKLNSEVAEGCDVSGKFRSEQRVAFNQLGGVDRNKFD